MGLEDYRENPNLHDKVEFEIIPTSYYFDFTKRLKKFHQD